MTLYISHTTILLTNLQEVCTEDNKDSEVVDSKGIPGWDKVYQLARALLALDGLGLTNAQAREIKELYHQLEEYDKRPLQFTPCKHKKPLGCFGRSKRVDNVSLDYMKRLFSFFIMERGFHVLFLTGAFCQVGPQQPLPP